MARKAYGVINSYDDIEDIIQDAIVYLIRKYDTLKSLSEAHLVGYMLLVVKTTAIAALRKKYKDRKWSYYGAAEDIAADAIDSHTPEMEYLRSEEREKRLDAIARLTEAEQDLLLYKYVLEKSNRELAQLYSTSEMNIRQMLSRTRKKLCKWLEDKK